MTNLRKITTELEKLGIPERQTLIYLCLIQYGELRVQEIADLTKTPRSSVYESLDALLESGLVGKVVADNFTRIKAYPISSMKHDLNDKLLKLQAQMQTLDGLEKTISALTSINPVPSTVVRYYKDLSGARQIFWNSLHAKSMVFVYSAYGRSKFVGKKFYADFVSESYQRNIKERVLINPTDHALNLIKRDAGSSLARTKAKDIRFLNKENLLIKGETFIYDNVYAQMNLSEDRINGFEIESASFTKTQKSIFKTLWRMAKPVRNLL